MSNPRPMLRILPFAALPLILGFTAPASAHGIHGDDADRSILGFVPVGIEHMLLGWDHLLFIAGVLLVASQVRLAAKLISLFALGHSATLITATLAGWRVNPEAVDVVIALSVVFVAGVGIIGRPKNFRLFGLAVFGFGLIHGLGLATRFGDLGIPEQGQLWRVIAFNVGIEIGQLVGIAVMAGSALVLASLIDPEKRPRAGQLACAPIFIGGTIAAFLLTMNAFTATPELPSEQAVDPAAVTLSDDTTCELTTTEPLAAAGGGHTEQAFFEPDQETPFADFAHSMGDGYVVILYPTDIATADLADLRDFVAGPEGAGVLAGPTEAEQLHVMQQRDTLICGEVELDSVESFSQNWLEPLRG